MNGFVVDAKSGNAVVDLVIQDEHGVQHTKHRHSMFNPAFSELEVLNEIASAKANPQSEPIVQANANTVIVGRSQSGSLIKVIVRPDGKVATAYPHLPKLSTRD
jgi:hypothetical protein